MKVSKKRKSWRFRKVYEDNKIYIRRVNIENYISNWEYQIWNKTDKPLYIEIEGLEFATIPPKQFDGCDSFEKEWLLNGIKAGTTKFKELKK